MIPKKKKTIDTYKQKQRAETALEVSSGNNDRPAEVSYDDLKILIHNLQLHQI